MYKLPDGSTTENKNIHHRMWAQYLTALEARFPKAQVTAQDDDVLLKLREGTVTLPRWFVVKLVSNTRTMDSRKFRPEATRSRPCEMCSTVVHTFGPGRNRRFCYECVKVRAKMRRGGDDD